MATLAERQWCERGAIRLERNLGAEALLWGLARFDVYSAMSAGLHLLCVFSCSVPPRCQQQALEIIQPKIKFGSAFK